MVSLKRRLLTSHLDDPTAQLLQTFCAETGCSRSEVVRDALRRQLRLVRFKRLRRHALAFGKAAGWSNEYDVFAAVP